MVDKKRELQEVIDRIAQDGQVPVSDLLPLLCLEKNEERLKVNLALAQAHASLGLFEKAQHFIQRSWILSKFDERVLPIYIDIHKSLNQIAPIEEAFKRIGMKKADEGKINEALSYFGQSFNVYRQLQYSDKHHFDFDIADRIERLASPHRFTPVLKDPFATNRQIRIGYIIIGLGTANSVLVKHNLSFAAYHDKSIFDITFYVPQSRSQLASNQHAMEAVENLKKFGCQVIFVPEAVRKPAGRHRLLAQEIYGAGLDVLVVNEQLGVSYLYYLTALRPAPIIIGLNHGHPYAYTSYLLDWSISWTKPGLMDTLGDGSFVRGGIEFPSIEKSGFYTKRDFALSEDDYVLISTGRPQKFQHKPFWKAIAEILRLRNNVHYFAVGVHKDQLSFLDELVEPDLLTRIHCLGWRNDAYKLLGIGDIYVDTFPEGGGFSIYEAMRVGLPAVSFENDYMKVFDQRDWSPAYEYFSVPELTAKRDDFEEFKRIVIKLLDDRDHRIRMGKLVKQEVLSHIGHPEKMVKACEQIYLRVLKNKVAQKVTLSSSKPQTDLDDLLKQATLQVREQELTLASYILKDTFLLLLGYVNQWLLLFVRTFVRIKIEKSKSKAKVMRAGIAHIMPQHVKDLIKKFI